MTFISLLYIIFLGIVYFVGGWFYCISIGYRFCEYFDRAYYKHLNIKNRTKFYRDRWNNMKYIDKGGNEQNIYDYFPFYLVSRISTLLVFIFWPIFGLLSLLDSIL